ncbi:ABC transporter substrate-binding protein [Rhodococcus qingshengii]|uniref:ABC transporter substrate-binding protein n=1 Tax=Rhodococcus qingshengii TaxID=334542 RepID=UPI001BE5D469|nr:ABC transporter substrate-binding protein [Rhodococcus qingshengii]MBT2272013.1 ABC transporter substrate-binding protein [Rhodococcus qingshengii]
MSIGSRSRRRRAIAATGALLLLSGAGATACSSSDDSSANPALDAPTTSLPLNPAKGEAVKIGFVSTEGGAAVSLPEIRKGAEAAAEYVNQNGGGLAGRPIDLIVCKQGEEPTSSTNCANQFVEQKVSVVLAPGTSQGPAIVPIVTGAGIPYVTLNAVSAVELTDPNVSALSAGLPGTLTAMATSAKDQGMKSFTIFASDGGGTGAVIDQMGSPIFDAMGVDLDVVPIALGIPDPTPLVASGLAGKPDGISVIADAALCSSVYKAVQTTDPNMKKVFIPVCLAPDVIKVIGMSAVEGNAGVSATDYLSDEPGSILYRSILQQYAPDVSVTGAAAMGYQTLMAVVAATDGIQGEVSAASIKDALKASRDVPMPAGGGVTFTCDGSAFPQMPTICSGQTLLGTLNDQGIPVDLKVTG